MDIDEIKTLMEAMAASDLSEMQVTKDGWTLHLTRGRPGEARAPDAVSEPGSLTPKPPEAKPAHSGPGAVETAVRSPLSGVVHFRPSPDAPPFVEAGASVAAGDVLCLVEAMKMFNEIRAERAGTVDALFVSGGADVEAGQPLLRIV